MEYDCLSWWDAEDTGTIKDAKAKAKEKHTGADFDKHLNVFAKQNVDRNRVPFKQQLTLPSCLSKKMHIFLWMRALTNVLSCQLTLNILQTLGS
jgi:hypothetical protein